MTNNRELFVYQACRRALHSVCVCVCVVVSRRSFSSMPQQWRATQQLKTWQTSQQTAEQRLVRVPLSELKFILPWVGEYVVGYTRFFLRLITATISGVIVCNNKNNNNDNIEMKLININKQISIFEVEPDNLAAQLTLLDLPIFKSIKKDELTSLGGSSSSNKPNKKQDLSPNVVAMNRQFNQVTFWVVGQILSHDSPRIRAELISNFIKTAKHLYQLNNLHSSYAVISALLSSPIYRLDKTWYFVRKKYPKERLHFDQLKELYSDNNNYELLRNHLANCDLPCIPYLGMYSRDIIYINEAHQEGTQQRTKSTSKILDSIEKFQQSEYDQLIHIPNISCFLLSSRYINELQKFVEDENYRRSLELEPPDHSAIIDSQNSHNVNSPDSSSRHHKKSAMLLASLTSMVHSAVITTSNKFGGYSLRRSSADSQKTYKYLIDDSFIDHTSFPPPISTSN